MKPPENMTQTIDRKRYSTATATLLCGDDRWDGHNFEKSGRQTFLYRTPGGAYFIVGLTQWQGEADGITPQSEELAMQFHEWCQRYGNVRVAFEDAFPGVVQDA